MKRCCMFHLVLVAIAVELSTMASSQSIVRALPGYPAPLPFKLETGYIGVGENDQVQLFYYFIESEGDPKKDPLLFWLTGGPGCTGLFALAYEIGPLAFDFAALDGSLPSFTLNPYSWTKFASIIFIDSPVGTGFSYATTPEAYATSDTKATKDNYLFLRKWLLNHPEFIESPLYVGGDSYAGKIVPMVALEIAKGNEAGLEPQMSLQGYAVGNPRTDKNQDNNEVIPYAHRMALVSDEVFELAKSSCDGEYDTPDPNNVACLGALGLVKECTNHINQAHILEPTCADVISSRSYKHRRSRLLSLRDDPAGLIFLSEQEEHWCRYLNYDVSEAWANDETVREALHIRKGSIADWKECNRNIPYEHDIQSVLQHHQLLSDKGFQALAYSGDHDMMIPYMSTLKWIRDLNLTVGEQWRPWIVDGQVAGYTVKFKNNFANLTFATVKGIQLQNTSLKNVWQ